MQANLPLVTLACSASADADCVQRFHSALFPVLRALEADYRFEIVYRVDEAAEARSSIKALAQLDPRIRIQPLTDAAANEIAQLNVATNGVLIVTDVAAHSPDVVPQLLELAKGPAVIVIGVPQLAPPVMGWRRWFAKQEQAAPPLVLLKPQAVESLRANAELPLVDALAALELPRAELAYVPNRVADAPCEASAFGRIMGDLRDIWRRTPLALISHFGATVFVVGVFLAFWFCIQGLASPGTVWFSWCYLIVLLHLLGGSILFALGKVGAQANRILEQLQQRRGQ